MVRFMHSLTDGLVYAQSARIGLIGVYTMFGAVFFFIYPFPEIEEQLFLIYKFSQK